MAGNRGRTLQVSYGQNKSIEHSSFFQPEEQTIFINLQGTDFKVIININNL